MDLKYTLILPRDLTEDEDEILSERFPDAISGLRAGTPYVGGFGSREQALAEMHGIVDYLLTLGITEVKAEFGFAQEAWTEAVPA